MNFPPRLTTEAQSQLGQGPERIATVPTLTMTLFRAVAGAYLPYHMARGKRGAAAISVLAALSDKESWGAIYTENALPGKGLGFSEFGKSKDPIVDGEYIAGAAIGILLSPNVPIRAKIGGALAIAKVVDQAKWAKDADDRHREATGEPLVITVGWTGKIATALTLAAEAGAGATHDLNPDKPFQAKVRKHVARVVPILSGAGTVLGVVARKQNEKQLQGMLKAHHDKKQ